MDDTTPNTPSRSGYHSRAWLWLVAVLLFVAGALAGSYYTTHQIVHNENGAVEITKVLDLYGKSRSSDVSFAQFWDIWNKIKGSYVTQPVNEVDLFYGALKGMVAGLDDPYSTYFPPTEAKEFARDLAGAFEGIGAEIGMRDNQLVVVAPLPGSPAEEAGLRSGDKIYAIDGEETFQMTLEEAVSRIRGTGGSSVVLSLSHNGVDTIQDVSVIRATITIPTVMWEQKEGQIAYLRISYFNETTWSDFDKAVEEILRIKPKGIILDMRNNPGGYLQTSIEVASEWIPEGTIVIERFADGKENTHKSVGTHRFADIPTMVLVDEGTASGSEIVAGALQDYGVGEVLGAQSFGKGSVQDFEILPDGSALKLTIAKWFTPKGRAIDKEGITPDILIDQMFVPQDPKDDTSVLIDMGLQRALEEIGS